MKRHRKILDQERAGLELHKRRKREWALEAERRKASYVQLFGETDYGNGHVTSSRGNRLRDRLRDPSFGQGLRPQQNRENDLQRDRAHRRISNAPLSVRSSTVRDASPTSARSASANMTELERQAAIDLRLLTGIGLQLRERDEADRAKRAKRARQAPLLGFATDVVEERNGPPPLLPSPVSLPSLPSLSGLLSESPSSSFDL